MRFNSKNTGNSKTINQAGGKAYQREPQTELVTHLLTSFVQDQFYRSADAGVDRLVELVAQNDPLFAAKAAIYARNEFGMRTVTHIVAAEIFRKNGTLESRVAGKQWPKHFINNVVRRPDDALEIMSYYAHEVGDAMPKQLQKGTALALEKFDKYQLAKYRNADKDLKLVDLVNLTHPKATRPIHRLINHGDGRNNLTLESPATWSNKMSQAGLEAKDDEQLAKAKEQVWHDFLTKKNTEYFALLRNLRNIIEQASDKDVELAASKLTDKRAIKKSLVMPFRYITAQESLQGMPGARTNQIMAAISDAIEISLENVPTMPGRTLVALDGSGSMTWGHNVIENAALFAATIVKSNDADLLVFDFDAQYVTLNTHRAPLSNLTSDIVRRVGGGGTNFDSIFHTANQKYDRIITLSDEQGWAGHDPVKAFDDYKRRTGANPSVFSWDLAGYGNTQLHESNVYLLSGFSEKAFDIMKLLDEDRNALIKKIKAIEIENE